MLPAPATHLAGAGRFPEGHWPVSGRSLARGPHPQVPQGHPRVAKRSSGRSSTQRPCLQVLQCHPRVAKRASIGTLARRPYPQLPQWHPRVAKHSSDRSSARRPSTESLLGQGRVPKERESLPLQGLWSSLRPGLARHPRLQIVLRQGRVAKRASIGTLARGLLPKVLQRHPSVAKRGFRPTLRHGDPQQNHLRDGSARRRNLFSNKDY